MVSSVEIRVTVATRTGTTGVGAPEWLMVGMVRGPLRIAGHVKYVRGDRIVVAANERNQQGSQRRNGPLLLIGVHRQRPRRTDGQSVVMVGAGVAARAARARHTAAH